VCDECAPNHFGSTCSPCGTCIENAECLDGLQGNGSCVCSSGWEGLFCNVSQRSDAVVFSKTLPVALKVDGKAVLGRASVSADLLTVAAGQTITTGNVATGSVLVWERANVSVPLSSVTPITLNDPEGASYGNMGKGVIAISSSGLVLAAPFRNDGKNGVSSGSVMVWERADRVTSLGSVTPVRLTDPDGSANDFMSGGGLAISGDGLVLVATADGDDDLGGSSGSLLVWQRTDSTTSFSTVTPWKLTDPAGAPNNNLGKGGVSMSADGLVIAAASDQDAGVDFNRGSVLVWQRSNLSTPLNNVSPVKLFDPDGARNDVLGAGGVALSPDGLVLAVPSPQDDDMGSNSGSISIWQREDLLTSFDSVTPVKLTDSEGFQDAKLGNSGVSIGRSDAGDIAVAVVSGSLIVLFKQDRISSNFTSLRLEESYMMETVSVSPDGSLICASSTGGMHPGVSVFEQGCSPGWVGDLCDMCQTGYYGSDCAPCHCQYGYCNDGLEGDGTCDCIFASGAQCDVIQAETVVGPTVAARDHLGLGGIAVSSNGLVVAASSNQDDDKGSNSGSISVWQRADISTSLGSVTPEKVFDPNGAQGDFLGYGQIALSADGLVLAAASYADDDKGMNSGSVLVWQRSTTSASLASVTPVKLVDPNGGAADGLGKGGVALSSDGLVLAASPLDDQRGTDTGSVLVWQRADRSTSFSSVTPLRLFDPDAGGYDKLGEEGVAISSNGLVLATSTAQDDDMGISSGSVLVWQRPDLSTSFGSVSPAKLVDPDGAVSDNLGTGGVALSSDGLVLAAAAFNDDDMGPASGSVLVWERTDISTDFSTVVPVKLLDPRGEENDYLGYAGVSLSSDGLILAASSYQDDDMGSSSGSVLVWKRADLNTSFSSVSAVKLTDPNGSASQSLGKGCITLSSDGRMLLTNSYGDTEAGAVVVFST